MDPPVDDLWDESSFGPMTWKNLGRTGRQEQMKPVEISAVDQRPTGMRIRDWSLVLKRRTL